MTIKTEKHPAAVMLAVVCTIASFPLSGYVIVTLWDWFIVPLGAVRIGVAHGLGIGFLVRYMAMTPNVATKENDEWWMSSAMAIIWPLVVLFFAWITHWFMVN